MKVLELYAGTRSIGKGFERMGVPREDIYSIEIDTQHEDIDWYADIGKIEVSDIVERFGVPDVIWASPPCQTYSIAGIFHHRRKDRYGYLQPISEFARKSDELLEHTVSLITNLLELNPNLIWFIENPMGGMRKSKIMKFLPRYLVTYCQYGDTRRKPTDIFTNHPDPEFKPPCKNGDPCHVSSPRHTFNEGSTQGLRDAKIRSVIPDELCDHIAKICLSKTDERCYNVNQTSILGWCE